MGTFLPARRRCRGRRKRKPNASRCKSRQGWIKRSGIVRTQRGAAGGYWLATPASEISLAQVIRAVEGPLANVRGEWPEAVEYRGAAIPLTEVWIAVRANLRAVLETVTLADLVEGSLPAPVEELTRDPDAWVHH